MYINSTREWTWKIMEAENMFLKVGMWGERVSTLLNAEMSKESRQKILPLAQAVNAQGVHMGLDSLALLPAFSLRALSTE